MNSCYRSPRVVAVTIVMLCVLKESDESSGWSGRPLRHIGGGWLHDGMNVVRTQQLGGGLGTALTLVPCSCSLQPRRQNLFLLILKFFFNSKNFVSYYFVCVLCVWHEHVHATVWVWRLEDAHWTGVLRFRGRHLYPLECHRPCDEEVQEVMNAESLGTVSSPSSKADAFYSKARPLNIITIA